MTYESLEDRVSATERLLMQACIEYGFPITGDQRISEPNAATLLGVSAGTLANKRSATGEPRAYKLSASSGEKISYRIRDLAFYIESRLVERDFF